MPQHGPPDHAGDTRPRVLVVEDEPDLGDRLARTLEAAGFEVERVEGAQEAAAGIEKRRPDLALVDCLLSGFAAFRLCRRSARPDTVRLDHPVHRPRRGARVAFRLPRRRG